MTKLTILHKHVLVFLGDIVFGMTFKSVYKELHADHETGAADNK